ncbi:MAG: porin family protein [Zetaproteobacteria bacterium]|nr:porin family protein [Zetaproteobacteria bacterium]
MKMIRAGLILSAVVGVTVSAQAAEIKPYVGMGVGAFTITSKASGPGYGYSQKNTVMGTFAKAGVDFNDYVGFEVRAGISNNASKDWPASTNANYPNGFTWSNKVQFFSSYLFKVQERIDHWGVYVLGGATQAKYQGRVAATVNPSTSTVGKIAYTIGIGTDYDITDHFRVEAEYISYQLNQSTQDFTTGSTKSGFQSANLNVSYHY